MATISILFGIGDESVKFGLVAILAQSDCNATGASYFTPNLGAKPRRICLIGGIRRNNQSGTMATGKQLNATILARRTAKGSRKKRTRPEPRQYTVADLERARDRVAAAERRIDNDRRSNPNRGRAGFERAQLELSFIESQLRLCGLLE
jgi:hypothetical protein